MLLDGLRIGRRTRGELLGEIAFLLDSGERVVTVRSITAGRVMVMPRDLLERLGSTCPKMAQQVLINLSRELASRLEHVLRELHEARARARVEDPPIASVEDDGKRPQMTRED